MTSQQFGQKLLVDRGLPSLQSRHFLQIPVDTDNAMPQLGETERRNQAHVSGADNYDGTAQIHLRIHPATVPIGSQYCTIIPAGPAAHFAAATVMIPFLEGLSFHIDAECRFHLSSEYELGIFNFLLLWRRAGRLISGDFSRLQLCPCENPGSLGDAAATLDRTETELYPGCCDPFPRLRDHPCNNRTQQ